MLFSRPPGLFYYYFLFFFLDGDAAENAVDGMPVGLIIGYWGSGGSHRRRSPHIPFEGDVILGLAPAMCGRGQRYSICRELRRVAHGANAKKLLYK